MKKLSLAFGLLGILFLSYGLYLLFNITDVTNNVVYSCIMGGFLSSALFLITDKMADEKN